MPRKKSLKNDETVRLIETIVKGMAEKKAVDPVILDFSKLPNAFCRAFIVCHGTNRTQVEAIADSVIDCVKKETGVNPWHKEGVDRAEWILIDYADVVVHVFEVTRRTFYNLEHLWGDALVTRPETH
jgi:ribosome-associated protein